MNDDAAVNRQRLRMALSEDQNRLFEVWARQKAGEIDRNEAANRLGMTVDEYEAGKKRLVRTLQRLLKNFGLEPGDLTSADTPDLKVVGGRGQEKDK